jgi:hypothetical protein
MSDHKVKLWGFGKKEEWQKSKYKQGQLIFKNVLIGSYFPNGLACNVNIKDGALDVRGTDHPLQFLQTLTYAPKTNNLTITITPRIYGMQPEKMTGTQCKSYDDVHYWICEDPYTYKVSVFSNKASVPLPSQPHV